MEHQLPVNYNKLSPHKRKEVRDQYVRDQNNICMYCKCSLSGIPSLDVTSKHIDLSLFPRGFLNSPIHLQHNHSTGMTEGAVHAYCNAVMWQYENR